MMQEREFRQMCKDVAEEFDDVSTEQVMQIVRDSFEFAQKHISEGSLTPVYFQYLGRFRASPGRIKWLKERKHGKQQQLHTERNTSDAPEDDGVSDVLAE